LCDAVFSVLFRFDGELLHLVAEHNFTPEALEAARQTFPAPLSRALPSARAILDRAVTHLPDVQNDPESDHSMAQAIGARGVLAVPMFREGSAIGTITVSRAVPGLFSPKQIELLQTFAAQAVIAIENVRLFTELQEKNHAVTEAHAQVTESLEQQTATAEILRVISGSPTDVQPVFDAIVGSAVRLCDGTFCSVTRFDGELLHQVAVHNFTPEALEVAGRRYPMPLSRQHGGGRAILDRAVCHIADVESDPDYDSSLARAIGFRSLLVVPMFREGNPIGAIAVGRGRGEPGPFSEKQIELLKTFADQAVIAIENVRLFQELEVRNVELTGTLARQTATGEVLRAISRAQTDASPCSISSRRARSGCVTAAATVASGSTTAS
jgi:two-component system, NtrC family, sensor kinase